MLDMEVEGVRPRRRPKLCYADTIRGDIKKNGLMDINIFDSKDENGSIQGDPLMWKSFQGENEAVKYTLRSCSP